MDDFQVDDLLAQHQAKKHKIKSGAKGKGAEREIVHLLNERFKAILDANPKLGQFSRSVGSGNRWGQQVILSEVSKQIYAGDITCPDGFLWVIESKKGYNDIDLCSCFDGKCGGLDEFLTQVTADAERTGRKPLLIWKKDRKERVAFVKSPHLPCGPDAAKLSSPTAGYSCLIAYQGWVGVPLPELLAAPDACFFRPV